MSRSARFVAAVVPCFAVISALSGVVAHGQTDAQTPPVTYEVLVNGESFRVQENRIVKVQSKEHPGTTYELAVRLSPAQQLRLNSVQLEYDLSAKASDDRGREQRTVYIKHELGFTIMLTDMGSPLSAKGLDDALRFVTEFATKKARQQNASDLTVSEPDDWKYAHASGKRVKLQYKDSEGRGHTCLAGMLGGKKFAVACVVDYRDKDSADAEPLIARTLDSLRPLP